MGLRAVLSVRPVASDGQEGGLPPGTRSVSVFLVNRRPPAPDETRDEAFAFQTQLEVASDAPLVPRPNLRSLESDDWDERVADLQYRDVCEYAVGHSVATEAVCAERPLPGGPDLLDSRGRGRAGGARPDHRGRAVDGRPGGLLADGADAKAKLGRFVDQYRAWIDRPAGRRCRSRRPGGRRRPRSCCDCAGIAADRIERGIALLADPQCLEAFRIANRAMATAAQAAHGRHATRRTRRRSRPSGGRSSLRSS